MRPLLEICVDDVAGIRAAVGGGADRVELCAALEVGGLTPSPGLVAFALSLGIRVRALIRPRAGDFIFDDDAEQVMQDDIRTMLALGVEGVVLGAARADGCLNADMLGRLMAAARAGGARGVTLNRVVDLAPDLDEAIDQAARLGFDSVLTSGGAPTAPEAAATLARLQRRAPPSLTVMAGSGVTAATVGALIAASGVRAVHASAREEVAICDTRLVQFGFSQSQARRASAATVRALREATDAAAAGQTTPAPAR
jgi:copper homeostasis protein